MAWFARASQPIMYLKYLISLIFLLPHFSTASGAVDSVTIRVGYLQGLLPGLKKIHHDLQNAQSAEHRRFAVGKAYNWSFLIKVNELNNSEVNINHTSIIQTGLNLLNQCFDKYRATYVSRRYFNDTSIPDPAFEEVKSIVDRLLRLVLEEVNNPNHVDKSLPIYEKSFQLSLKFTIGFLSTYAAYPVDGAKSSAEFKQILQRLIHNLEDVKKLMMEVNHEDADFFKVIDEYIEKVKGLFELLPKGRRPVVFYKFYDEQLTQIAIQLSNMRRDCYSKLDELQSAKTCKQVLTH